MTTTQRWSRRQPSRPGWYWFRWSEEHNSAILRIEFDDDGVTLLVRTGDYADQINFLQNYNGQWSGPLRQPL